MSEFNPAPEDEKDDVLFSVRDKIGLVQLNRPKKLHSLNISMLRKLISVLAVRSYAPCMWCSRLTTG